MDGYAFGFTVYIYGDAVSAVTLGNYLHLVQLVVADIERDGVESRATAGTAYLLQTVVNDRKTCAREGDALTLNDIEHADVFTAYGDGDLAFALG